ncbi:MAG: hypothetical protein HY773_01085 [Candidatus Terrybacteria bacterium]|nr:hypothetical protein [Candidatus Terrybacteria bacterium]
MNGAEKIESAEQEIEALKKRITELEAASVGKERPEIIREAIKEHAEKIPKEILGEPHRLLPEEIKAQAERISGLKTAEEPHQRQVAELLQFAQDKGILNAVSIIKEINDPHLEDDFHDALAQFFQGIKNV